MSVITSPVGRYETVAVSGSSRISPIPPENACSTESMRKLYIEPTTRCNLNCKMCFRQTWVDEPFCDMPDEVFTKALETLPGTVEKIFFGGMGEPLCHPDILSMLRRAKATGRFVEVITNGTLLTDEFCEALIDTGIDRLWISVDDLQLNHGENFQGHIAHSAAYVERFHRHRLDRRSRNLPEPLLGITFVATKSNVAQLKDLPNFINAYAINDVNISNILPADKASIRERLYDRVLERELFCSQNSSGRVRIELPYADWNIPDFRDAAAGMMDMMAEVSMGGTLLRRRTGWCRFIEEGCCFVRPDGHVSPCMGLLHSTKTWLYSDERTVWHHSFGTLPAQSLPEVWNSPEYTAFRDRVHRFTFSPCTHCGGCEFRTENRSDCFGNPEPTCGGCLWSEGIITCP